MIEERVKSVLADCLAVDELNLGDRLIDLGMDSLDLMDIQYRLEGEFDFDIEKNIVTTWGTVKDIVDFVEVKNEHFCPVSND